MTLRKTIPVLFMLMAFTTLIAGVNVSGKTWIVDDDAGTWSDASDINDVISSASNGDTVRVFSGTYHENVDITKSITLIGNGSSLTTIDADGTGIAVEVNADGITIEDLGITRSGSGSNIAGLFADGRDDLTIISCVIYDNSDDGMYLKNANDANVTDSYIQNNGANGVFLWACNRFSYVNCTFSDNDINGLALYNSKTAVSNCSLHGNGYDGIRLSGTSANSKIIYTAIYENDGYGINLSVGSDNNIIHHCNFTDNGVEPQASDSGDSNEWDDGSVGNYWSDYDGSDSDKDRIGDTEYELDGEALAVDEFPLMKPWNFQPRAWIVSIDPIPAPLGHNITFIGDGSDRDGSIVSFVWTSSRQGTFYNGAPGEVNYSGLLKGDHVITFKVVDDKDLSSERVSWNITVLAKPNVRPNATVFSVGPDPSEVGTLVKFQGVGEDEDGYIVRYVWFSSIDGEIYNGSSNKTWSTSLNVGTHTISFKVKDNKGSWSEVVSTILTIEPHPLTAEIVTVHPSPAVTGQNVTFVGCSVWGGNISEYSWRSSIDGFFSTSANGTTTIDSLSIGEHIIYLTIKDDLDQWSDEVSTSLSVRLEPNSSPTAVIRSITPNPATRKENTTFIGSGSDEEGAIALFSWSSSVDGEFSNSTDNTTIYSGLSMGFHTIYLQVMDMDGAWSEPASSGLAVQTYPGGNNSQPTCSIRSITPNIAIPNEELTFDGNGRDKDGSIIQCVWTSNIDGTIYNGADLDFSTSDMSIGIHQISMSVMDSKGAWSLPAYRVLIISLEDEHNGSMSRSWSQYGLDHRNSRNVTNVSCAGLRFIDRINLSDTSNGVIIQDDGVLYTSSGDLWDGSIHAIDHRSMERLWRWNTTEAIAYGPAITEGVLVAPVGESVYGFSFEGGIVWNVSLGPYYSSIDSHIKTWNGLVIVTFGSDVIALDPSGRILWRTTVDGYIGAAPAIDSAIYVGTIMGRMHALDPFDGSVIWSNSAETACFTSPVVCDEYVIFGTGYVLGNGSIIVLNKGLGNRAWERTFESPIECSPVVHEGTVVFSVGEDVRCHNLENGKMIWTEKVGPASDLVVAGDSVIVTNPMWLDFLSWKEPSIRVLDIASGRKLFKYGFESWEDANLMGGPFHPIIVNDSLFVIYDTYLYKFEIEADDGSGSDDGGDSLDLLGVRLGSMLTIVLLVVVIIVVILSISYIGIRSRGGGNVDHRSERPISSRGPEGHYRMAPPHARGTSYHRDDVPTERGLSIRPQDDVRLMEFNRNEQKGDRASRRRSDRTRNVERRGHRGEMTEARYLERHSDGRRRHGTSMDRTEPEDRGNPIHCPECDSELESNARFCSECGIYF